MINNVGFDTWLNMRDKFQKSSATVNHQPNKGTHWLCPFVSSNFGSYGCVLPKKTLKYMGSLHGNRIGSETEIQQNSSLCGSSH